MPFKVVVILAFAHCCPGNFFGSPADDKMLAQCSISPGRHSRFRGNEVKQKWGAALNSSHLPGKSDEVQVFAMLSPICKFSPGQQWAFAGMT